MAAQRSHRLSPHAAMSVASLSTGAPATRLSLTVVALALAMLPWLFPFTSGPSAAALPWLASAAAGCALGCLSRWEISRRTLAVWALCVAMPAWAWISQGSVQPDATYLLAGLVLIGLTAAVAQDELVRRSIILGILGAAMLSAVFGLLQYFGASVLLHPWVNFANIGEAYANLRQTNQFATLCAMGIAIVLWGVPDLRRTVAAPIVGLLACSLAASVSRTGLLEGLLLCGLAAAWNDEARGRRLGLCLVAATSYVAASIVLPLMLQLAGEAAGRTLWARVSAGDSCSSRLVLWSNVLTLIAAHPIAGWGWGELDFAHFMARYDGVRFCEILDNAHNLPLHLAVELGVPVAVLLCAGGVAWSWRQRPWRESAPERQLAWAVLGVLGLHSLLEYPLWYGPFQIAFGTALAVLLMDPPDARSLVRLRMQGLLVSAALMLGVGYAAWDYWRVSQIYLPPEKRRPEWRDDPMLQARQSVLFPAQGEFAELTLTSVRRDNAAWMAVLAGRMLHYSPEPRVVEQLLEALTLLGRDAEAVAILTRYRAAYPAQYEAWRVMQRLDPPGRAQD